MSRIHLSIFVSVIFLLFTAVLFLYDRLNIKAGRSAVWTYCILTLVSVLVLQITPIFSKDANVSIFFLSAVFTLIQIWFLIMLIVWAIRKLTSK